MKTCIDTIKNWVDRVSSEITGVEVIYGINRELNYHIVLIRPSNVYNSEEYIKLESEFDNEFYSLFPNEDIIITDDDSIIDITEFIVKPSIFPKHMEYNRSLHVNYKFDKMAHYGGTSEPRTYALAA